jgi:pimeloyl-ACP methyl ester carboxylesterase
MGCYIDAGGLRTYYEVHGVGAPLVLLHGGLATADSWAAQVPELARHYCVYLPERRGHGRTPDVDGPIGYATMATDTGAFLDELDLGGAHLVGWSDGAVVAALVAIARPELVDKLVLVGQYLRLDGQRPESRAALGAMMADPGGIEPFRALHAPLSPDGPDHFPVVFAKMLHLWWHEPDVPLADLARIAAPTLIMQGDDDVVRVEHSALLARTFADAQLAVIPGTSHALPLEKPELVNRLVLDFLAAGQPRKLLPLSARVSLGTPSPAPGG